MLHRASWSHLDHSSTVESIRRDPDLASYVEEWGRPGDIGLIACGPHRLGAAWVRRLIGARHGFIIVDTIRNRVGTTSVKMLRTPTDQYGTNDLGGADRGTHSGAFTRLG